VIVAGYGTGVTTGWKAVHAVLFKTDVTDFVLLLETAKQI
jgi:hypothetical protein